MKGVYTMCAKQSEKGGELYLCDYMTVFRRAEGRAYPDKQSLNDGSWYVPPTFMQVSQIYSRQLQIGRNIMVRILLLLSVAISKVRKPVAGVRNILVLPVFPSRLSPDNRDMTCTARPDAVYPLPGFPTIVP